MATVSHPSNRFSRAALAALVLSLAALPAAARGEEAATERYEKSFELDGITKVKLQNVNGPVHVSSWDKAFMRLTAVKKAKGANPEETLKKTEIRVSKIGSVIEIETVLPKRRPFDFFFWGGTRSADVSYDLSLPPAVALELETVNGKITAESRTGSLSLSTVNGAVRVEGHDAPLKVNTVNGSVEAVFLGPMKETSLETVNGSVTVACSKESSIRYELQTVNGRIQSEFANLAVEGKWGPKEARGSWNGGRERLAVETVNGEVRLVAALAHR